MVLFAFVRIMAGQFLMDLEFLCGGFKYNYFSESNRPVASAQSATPTGGPWPSIVSSATHGPILPSLDQERGQGKGCMQDRRSLPLLFLV